MQVLIRSIAGYIAPLDNAVQPCRRENSREMEEARSQATVVPFSLGA